MFTATLLAACLFSADPHIEANPILRTLVKEGFEAGGSNVRVRPPALADDVPAGERKKVIEKLLGSGSAFSRFAQKSPVAPQIVRMRDIETADKKTRVRAVDVYFIAYADFGKLADKAFLEDVFRFDAGGDSSGKELKDEDLAERKIERNREHEFFGYGTTDLIKKVRLSIVGRTYFSKTGESVVAAVIVDPRFKGDAEFPNRWKPVGSDEYEAYAGAAAYIKITRLAEPEGALFAEAHIVYSEPHGWFQSRNLLGSKLPVVIQDRVRATRRNMLRQSREP